MTKAVETKTYCTVCRKHYEEEECPKCKRTLLTESSS